MVEYNEDLGEFTIKNDNKKMNEKDLSIIKINELKEKANLTTLTREDIDILYLFYTHEFDNKFDKDKFMSIALKNLFVGLDDKKLILNYLMPMAYNYENAIDKGLDRPIIEKFAVSSTTHWNVDIFIVCFGFIIILIFTYYMLLRYYNK